MTEKQIKDQLIRRGRELFDAPRKTTQFVSNSEADQLLKDLKNTPHAFVIGCVMDRQIKAEYAWIIPYVLSQKIGGFDFECLEKLSEDRIHKLMTRPEPLHRFPEEMGKNLYAAIKHIKDEYGGNASRIWTGKPSSADVVYRFLQFRGIGPKIATMGANILARDFKIPFSDYYSIDVSVDVHVRRVFQRLGLITENASIEEVIYRARALNPEFPGMLDLPAWEIGRNWCRPKHARCDECFMNKSCPTAGVDIK